MTSSTRRQKIEAMLKDEPDDIFLRYSLAMEMSSEGQIESALDVLKQLRELSPPYVPAFFRCAQILVDDDRMDEAREHLRDGIEAARAQGDLHAAAEMGEMLSDLGSA